MNESQIAVLIYKAIHTLNIDVPIMATKVVGNQIELHLYGGRMVIYPPDDQIKDRITSSIAEVNHPAVRDLEALELSMLKDLARRKGITGVNQMSRRKLVAELRASK